MVAREANERNDGILFLYPFEFSGREKTKVERRGEKREKSDERMAEPQGGPQQAQPRVDDATPRLRSPGRKLCHHSSILVRRIRNAMRGLLGAYVHVLDTCAASHDR